MWVGYLFSFIIVVRFGYLKIKNSNNCLGLIPFIFKRFLKSPKFGNLKRGSYEMRAWDKVCD